MRIRNHLKSAQSSLNALADHHVNLAHPKFIRGCGLYPRVYLYTNDDYKSVELDGFHWGLEMPSQILLRLLKILGASEPTQTFIAKVRVGCDWVYFPTKKHVKIGVDPGFRITYNACERFYRK